MLFTSLDFALFLLVAFAGYHLCPGAQRKWYLLLASYAFYFSWSVPFAFVLLLVSTAAWYLALGMAASEDDRYRRRLLLAGLLIVPAPLLTLKYVAAPFGVERVGVFRFAAAVGVSYYTFKLVSYLVDSYWRRVEARADFASVAAYAAFFPQILSGPIQRAEPFFTQLDRAARVSPALMASGVRLILFGLFQKLVIADRLAVVVDHVFANPERWPGSVLALGCYFFTFQLYADFAGISNIAIGAGRLFGICAPPNFDSPIYSESIQEFWRRWHMTLTQWLTDYVFMPVRMALRNHGQVGLALALCTNMMVVAIWHGATLTFMLFGAIQATCMIVATLTARPRKRLLRAWPLYARLHPYMGMLVTFHLMMLSLALIRADTFASGVQIISKAAYGLFTEPFDILAGHPRLFRFPGWGGADIVIGCAGLLAAEIVHLLQRRRLIGRLVLARPVVCWVGYVTIAFVILLWGEGMARQFIYARF